MRALAIFCGVIYLAGSSGVFAHHAVGPNFDQSRLVEVEGVITEVIWRNPHVLMSITGTGPDGEERAWDIEGNSVSNVSRLGLSPALLELGTPVRVAGNPGRVNEHSMWLQNILLPNSEEILFTGNARPRWSGQIITEDTRSAVATDPSGELGLFRVWSNATSPGALWGRNLPLTPAAQAVRDAFNPITDAPTLGCVAKGMPFVMEQPYPVEFVDLGDVIEMRLEEYDTVREFFMSPDAAPPAIPGIVGHSVAHWEGDTLVVETTNIDYPWFNGTGIPQSPAARITERFTVNADGSRLDYSMTYSDPATFTRALTLNKAWEWRPGEQVRPFDCLPD